MDFEPGPTREWKNGDTRSTPKLMHINVEIGHGKSAGGRNSYAFLIPSRGTFLEDTGTYEFVCEDPEAYYIDVIKRFTEVDKNEGILGLIEHIRSLS